MRGTRSLSMSFSADLVDHQLFAPPCSPGKVGPARNMSSNDKEGLMLLSV